MCEAILCLGLKECEAGHGELHVPLQNNGGEGKGSG